MNALYIETALRIAGLILSGLVVANFIAPRKFEYRKNLASSGIIVRQIFHVHCAYIIAIIAALALLCLGWPQLLMEKGMGQVLSAFFALFWFSRVVVQLTYYDKKLRARNRCWDVFFLAVFFVLGLIFTLTASNT
jgi:hypothetical protein